VEGDAKPRSQWRRPLFNPHQPLLVEVELGLHALQPPYNLVETRIRVGQAATLTSSAQSAFALR